MDTKVIKLDVNNPDLAKIKEAAKIVDSGGLVAFPTETVYGIASRAKTDTLNKLDNLKNRESGKYYTLHIADKSEIGKYVPTISVRTQKLIKNAWPGPLTIVFELSQEDCRKQRESLGNEIFENLYKDNSIGIRIPANPVASLLLQSATVPLVAPSANIAGQPPSTDAKQVLAQFDGQIDLILDAGACKYKTSSTVVKIGKEGLKVLRAGVYTEADLKKLSTIKFLFVCTGNTCRSPMAEGMFAKYLSEKLSCDVDRLEEKGYKVFSAGTMGISGIPASFEAVAACLAKGIDIKDYRSDSLSKELIDESDYIYGMGRMHCQRVLELESKAVDKCVLLAENKNVPDPIGQSQEVYDACAELIEKSVQKRISELKI